MLPVLLLPALDDDVSFPERVRDSAILRPVQDCRNGYGNALAIALIATLDDDTFEQTIEARLQAGKQWRGSRMHTLNSAGGLEFIDGSGRSGNRLLRRFQHATAAEFGMPSTRWWPS
jgi:hypothetical protein